MPSAAPSNKKKTTVVSSSTAAITSGASDSLDVGAQIKAVIHNRIRNLEKRKAKLESYAETIRSGKELTPDQKQAYSQLDSVESQIESHKEILQSVALAINEGNKQSKIQKKKDEIERKLTTVSRFKDLLKYQDVLNSMGNDSIRNEFLNGSGRASKCSAEDMQIFDDSYKKVCPSHEEITDYDKTFEDAANFAYNLVNSTTKSLSDNTTMTFAQLKANLDKILDCGYFYHTTLDVGAAEVKTAKPITASVTSTTIDEGISAPPVPPSSLDDNCAVSSDDASPDTVAATAGGVVGRPQATSTPPNTTVTTTSLFTAATSHNGPMPSSVVVFESSKQAGSIVDTGLLDSQQQLASFTFTNDEAGTHYLGGRMALVSPISTENTQSRDYNVHQTSNSSGQEFSQFNNYVNQPTGPEAHEQASNYAFKQPCEGVINSNGPVFSNRPTNASPVKPVSHLPADVQCQNVESDKMGAHPFLEQNDVGELNSVTRNSQSSPEVPFIMHHGRRPRGNAVVNGYFRGNSQDNYRNVNGFSGGRFRGGRGQGGSFRGGRGRGGGPRRVDDHLNNDRSSNTGPRQYPRPFYNNNNHQAANREIGGGPAYSRRGGGEGGYPKHGMDGGRGGNAPRGGFRNSHDASQQQ